MYAGSVTVVHTTDGCFWLGVLKTFDQFGNFFLDYTIQARQSSKNSRKFAELYVGIQLFRLESVMYFGDSAVLQLPDYLNYVGSIEHATPETSRCAQIFGPDARAVPYAEFVEEEKRLKAEQRQAGATLALHNFFLRSDQPSYREAARAHFGSSSDEAFLASYRAHLAVLKPLLERNNADALQAREDH